MHTTRTGSMEFHISRTARDRYQFHDSLFSLSGQVIIPNFYAARVFVQHVNEKRDLIRFPEQTIRAGQLNSMGLIDEILHYVAGLYRTQKNETTMAQALEWLDHALSRTVVDATLRQFAYDFPTVAVYRQTIDPQTYLDGETEGVPNRQIALEEMLMLWLANMNPAFSPFAELFDDETLENATAYLPIMDHLHAFFDAQPPFGPDHQNLIDMLRSPAIAVPHSLSGQLIYIRDKWGYLLGSYLAHLLSAVDMIQEEEKATFLGPGLTRPYEFAGLELELERFSADRDWMPNVVIIAKNTYVWMDQLSRRYQRSITRLDQIPDAELDTLARWGFSGLWLIGLWERSKASQRIKQMCGNPEAVASAYAIYDYQIAADLGGQEAYEQLKARAWKRGIRLASDMVPNHMGIDSQWVINHPDWFISLDYSPFPTYSFNGPDLSEDERAGIYLEDHYYTRTDAAVVFRRLDRWTGDARYIYHGNDGTSMPWNDTAQLNYLNPEVREAVIQMILHVARLFPIIRFDAAMTLTKLHYQRLWFPEPGSGGAIPSRAEHGMTKAQFNTLIPQEFWREVVDRMAEEVPDTLLLAEAFWMMEGYFVRSLGMHRVYNSAFMNMLKNEENDKYRTTMRNVLEFDPGILKRFVNFMNNPDEETAIAQFGTDDKYFGVCMMMVTMPGLPMFGHGQIEGFREKYGMEYRKAYRDEQPDLCLMQRHEREIFPLMRRRYLFAGVENFLLYDFFTPEGAVNENVFAYSNRAGEERALVIYHNKYATTKGWVRTSVAFRASSSQERTLVQKNLGEGLGLHAEPEYFCIFRDHVSGLEYIRNSREVTDQGLYVELGAFKYYVFLEFREVRDNEWRHYADLVAFLEGRGVPSIQDTLQERRLQPIHDPLKELLNVELFERLLNARVTAPDECLDQALLEQIEHKMVHVLRAIKQMTGGTGSEAALAQEVRRKLGVVLQLARPEDSGAVPGRDEYHAALHSLIANLTSDRARWFSLFGWTIIHALGKVLNQEYAAQQSRSWMDEWLLGRLMAATFRDRGMDDTEAWHTVLVIKLLTTYQHWFEMDAPQQTRGYAVLQTLLRDPDVQQFLHINRFQDVLWFNQETFAQLRWWMLLLAVVESRVEPALSATEAIDRIIACYRIVQQWAQGEQTSGYQVEKLLAAVQEAE